MLMLLLFIMTAAFLPVLSLDEETPTLEDDLVDWFAQICGNQVPKNSRAILRSLQEHPEKAPIFETFAQNTVYIGQLLIQKG